MSNTKASARPADARRSAQPPAASRARAGYVIRFLVLGLAYYAGARLGLSLALVGDVVTPVWPPTGIAVAALLAFGPRLWPAVAIAAFAVNLPIAPSPAAAGFIAAGNTAAVVLAAALLRRRTFDAEMKRASDALSLGTVALSAMTISAIVGTLTLLAFGGIERAQATGTLLVWWTGDSLGVLVLAPVLLLAVRPRTRRGLARRAEQVALAATAGVAALLAVWSRGPVEYLVILVPLAAAWRFGIRGAAPAVLAACGVMAVASAAGFGAFAEGSSLAAVARVQVFDAGIAFSAFFLAALVAERARATQELASSGAQMEARVRERTAMLEELNTALAVEIDEHTRAAKELCWLTARLDESQRIARIGSWDWEISSDTITWSDELYRIFDLEPRSFPATFDSFLERIHPDDRKMVGDTVVAALTDGRPFSFDHRVMTPSGDLRWVNGRGGVTLDDKGRPFRMSGTAQDITDRKRSEEAVQEALRRERIAADRLRAIDSFKDAMLTAVSHELRTPLSIVLGMAATLRKPNVAADPALVAELVGRIHVNAERLSRLLSDLMDLDRLKRGVIEPRRRSVDLTSLARTTVEQIDCGDHIVKIIGSPVVGVVDGAQVERIMENLVANAVRHTPGGSHIWVRLARTPDGTLVTVEDDGAGVSDDVKGAVFDVFWRGSGNDPAPGAGVGLSLVTRFAELHGGRAWVDDRPGGGAAFHVLLPDGPQIEPVQRPDSAIAS